VPGAGWTVAPAFGKGWVADQGSECLIDDHLGGDIAEFDFTPCFNLFLHWTEIPLHPVHAD
jgi:hypothetical protein